MAPFIAGWNQYDPSKPRRAKSISSELWDRFRATITRLHLDGHTKQGIVTLLLRDESAQQASFSPKLNQLVRQMSLWGLSAEMRQHRSNRPANTSTVYSNGFVGLPSRPSHDSVWASEVSAQKILGDDLSGMSSSADSTLKLSEPFKPHEKAIRFSDICPPTLPTVQGPLVVRNGSSSRVDAAHANGQIMLSIIDPLPDWSIGLTAKKRKANSHSDLSDITSTLGSLTVDSHSSWGFERVTGYPSTPQQVPCDVTLLTRIKRALQDRGRLEQGPAEQDDSSAYFRRYDSHSSEEFTSGTIVQVLLRKSGSQARTETVIDQHHVVVKDFFITRAYPNFFTAVSISNFSGASRSRVTPTHTYHLRIAPQDRRSVCWDEALFRETLRQEGLRDMDISDLMPGIQLPHAARLDVTRHYKIQRSAMCRRLGAMSRYAVDTLKIHHISLRDTRYTMSIDDLFSPDWCDRCEQYERALPVQGHFDDKIGCSVVSYIRAAGCRYEGDFLPGPYMYCYNGEFESRLTSPAGLMESYAARGWRDLMDRFHSASPGLFILHDNDHKSGCQCMDMLVEEQGHAVHLA